MKAGGLTLRFTVTGSGEGDMLRRASEQLTQFGADPDEGVWDLDIRPLAGTADGTWTLWQADVTWRRMVMG